jgi:hypothetical protein
VFVLDTNALLIPFTTGKQSLEEIRKIYTELAKQGRLAIPAQVAREFASNRTTKLTAVFQHLGAKRENIKLKATEYPLLESLPEYQVLLKEEQNVQEAVKKFQVAVDKVLDVMRDWRWNDPVSSLYRKIFDGNTIVELRADESDFQKDAKERFANRIPPGYKDGAKDENAFGDLRIWKTILQIGFERKTHVVFVSADEKPDWWHQSNNVALYPRYELVEEFRRVTDGKSFHIFSFAEFLKRLGADAETVSQVEHQQLQQSVLVDEEEIPRETVNAAVFDWLYGRYGAQNVKSAAGAPFDALASTDQGVIGFHIVFEPQMEQGYVDLLSRLHEGVKQVGICYVTGSREAQLRLLIRAGKMKRDSTTLLYVGYVRNNGAFCVESV